MFIGKGDPDQSTSSASIGQWRTIPFEKKFFKYGTGLLSRFQNRWYLKSRRTFGEAGYADAASAKEGLSRLGLISRSFDKEDIFNADEFGLLYDKPPNRTIFHKRLAGRKKEKTQTMGLACCNAAEKHKFFIMFIGRVAKLRCSNKKVGSSSVLTTAKTPSHGWLLHYSLTGWIGSIHILRQTEAAAARCLFRILRPIVNKTNFPVFVLSKSSYCHPTQLQSCNLVMQVLLPP